MRGDTGRHKTARQAGTMAAECIAFRVRVLNRVITNLYDAALGPYGITVNQATILIMLSLVGEASPGRIGRALVMEKSTVSRNLDRMKKQGWIESSGKEKGREQIISVTPAGRQLMKAIHPAWEKAQREAAEVLGESGVNAILSLHETVRRTTKSA